jgi:CRP/FNR family transcriptional regulator
VSKPEGVRDDVWRALRSARLWRNASDEAVEWLARVSQVAEYDRGEMIFREDTLPDMVGVIIDGHVRAVHSADGRSVVVETYWPGEVVGAISALSAIPFEADIETVEPAQVALIPVGMLKDLIVSEPTVAMSVIDEISRRWIAAVNVNKRSSTDVVSRVAHYLSELPRTRLGGPAYAVEIPVPRVELAASLGTTPETLSRAFHSLQEEGLIESHDRMIIVPDGEALIASRDGYHPKVLTRS